MQNIRLSKIEIIFFLIFVTLYFSTAKFIVAVNDGSQFAQTLAMGLEQRFSINSFIDYTRHVDYAFFHGNYYSDRTIGTSLIFAVPVYLANLVNTYLIHLGDIQNISKIICLLGMSIIGSANVIVLGRICEFFNLSKQIQFSLMVIFGACSLNWKYASLYMCHAPTTLNLLLATCLVLSPDITKNAVKQHILFFLLGFLVLMRYELLFTIPIFIVYLFYCHKKLEVPFFNSTLAISISCMVLPISYLCYYHTICYGGPLETYTKYYSPHQNYWKAGIDGRMGGAFTETHMFGRPFLDGLKLIFLGEYTYHQSVGLLVLHHYFILMLAVFLCKSFLNDKVVFISILFLLNLSLLSKTWGIDGGGMRDPRYVMPFIYIILILLGVMWRELKKEEYRQIFSACLIFFSATSCLFLLIHFSETDDWFEKWKVVKKEYKVVFLINPTVGGRIMQSLFGQYIGFFENIILVPIGVISVFYILYSLTKFFMSRIRLKFEFLRLSYVVMSLNTILWVLISYTLYTGSYLSIQKDTLTFAGEAVEFAVGKFKFVRKSEVFAKDFHGNFVSKEAISVRGLTEFTAYAPSYPSTLHVAVMLDSLSPDDVEDTIQNGVYKFKIKVNNLTRYVSEAVPLSNAPLYIKIPVEADSEIKLMSLPQILSAHGITAKWFDMRFEPA